MASNQTSNYGLNQWEATDQVLRTEFNTDNSKIDAALKGLADKDAELEGTLASQAAEILEKGNCRIYCIQHTGTGDESVTITFPQKPFLVMTAGGAYTLIALQGQSCNCISPYGAGETLDTSWDSNSLTWSGSPAYKICNSSNSIYPVLALVAADEA